ncbi:MAG TPA: hypothetical protein VMY87_06295 [Armatimonadota bacterium]|nr:hypothetical protein [Armatimonadota bacterium]
MSEDVQEKKPSELTDEELAGRLLTWHAEAIEANGDWRDDAAKAQRFRRGDQWDPTVRQMLERENRPHLTINHILPITNQVCGAHAQNPKDYRAFPRREGSTTLARVLTALVKHAMDLSNGTYHAGDVFKNGIVTGKGWYYARVDYSKDPEHGDLVISSLLPESVDEDPTAKAFDLNDPDSGARYVFVTEYIIQERARELWPEYAEDMGRSAYVPTPAASVAQKVRGMLNRWYSRLRKQRPEEEDVDGLTDKYRFRVVTAWWKEWRREATWSDRIMQSSMVLTKASDIAKAKKATRQQPKRFAVAEAVVAVLHKAVLVEDVLVERKEDPFGGVSRYPAVRYPAYHEAGRCFGMVDNLISPQEEENKRRSQALHNLNQSANSGWMVEERAVSDDVLDEMRQFGASPGIIIEHKPGKRPERIEPAKLSRGHMELAQLAAADMREISGVNTESLGYAPNAPASGRALALQQRQGAVTTQLMHTNFDHASELFGQLLVDLVRYAGLYSEEEIKLIVEKADLVDADLLRQAAETVGPAPQAPPPPNPDALAVLEPEDQAKVSMAYQETATAHAALMDRYTATVTRRAEALLLAELADIKKGSYDVRVQQSPSSPTQRMADLAELSECNQAYPGSIPPDIFVAATGLHNKEEIIERLREPTGPPVAGRAPRRPQAEPVQGGPL